MIKQYMDSYLQDLRANLEHLDYDKFEAFVDLLLDARANDRQVFIIGNGGSAATASHFACDLAKGTINYEDGHFRRFRALSLTDNVALITAIGNDISYEDIFVEQLRNYLEQGDIVISITASGNSPNLVRSVEYANSIGATTVGLLGFGGGKLASMVDVDLVVPSRNYGISEDFHLICEHILTQIIRRRLEDMPRRTAFIDVSARSEERAVSADDALDLIETSIARGYRTVALCEPAVHQASNERSFLDAVAERGIQLDGCFSSYSNGARSQAAAQSGLLRAISELNFEIDFQNSIVLSNQEGLQALAATLEMQGVPIDRSEQVLLVTQLDKATGSG